MDDDADALFDQIVELARFIGGQVYATMASHIRVGVGVGETSRRLPVGIVQAHRTANKGHPILHRGLVLALAGFRVDRAAQRDVGAALVHTVHAGGRGVALVGVARNAAGFPL